MLFKDRDSNTVTVLSTELPLGGSDLSYWILLWKRSSSISEKDWVLLVAELIVIMLQLLQALQYLHFKKKITITTRMLC